MSSIDGRITEYGNKLQELKTAFLEGVTVQTGITVVRMMNLVEHVGMSYPWKLRGDVHGFEIQRKSST